jgi:hypothetical protein
LAIAPVIALARSEATKAAKFAASARDGRRSSSVPVLVHFSAAVEEEVEVRLV